MANSENVRSLTPAADDAERRIRLDLAACYRLADRFGFSELVWNHITARVPGPENRFLINRFGLRFDEVTASNLVKLEQDGTVVDGPPDVNVTGYVLHRGVYTARADVVCVMHSHSPAGLAVSALEEGLLPVVQGAMMFYQRTAYHDYEGLSTEEEESARLAESLGEHDNLILRNHGLITVGKSVGEAFVRMYYLEQACRAQIDALSTGRALRLPPPEVCERAAQQFRHFPPGKFEWPALLRLLDEREPGYRE